MTLAGLLGFWTRKTAEVWASWGALLGLALLLGYFVTLTVLTVVFPRVNWDMVAYIAAALDNGSRSAAEIHQMAWSAVRDRVSEGDFLVITADRPYRVRQYADPQAFASMLGFYNVKILYVELGAWLSKWIQPVDAFRLISTVSAALLGVVIIAWATTERLLRQAPLILVVLVLCGVAAQVRGILPDPLSAVFFVLGIWCYLRRLDVFCALALLVAFLIRPDTLAFIGVFAVAAYIVRQGQIMAIATFLIALAAYFPITHYAEHPGWWVQMWFTNREYVPTLEGFDPDFSIIAYLKMLVRVAVRSIMEETWLVLFLMELLVLGRMVLRGVSMTGRETVLVCALAAATVAKYIVAPFHENRYFAPNLLALGMVLIGIWSRESKESAQPA